MPRQSRSRTAAAPRAAPAPAPTQTRSASTAAAPPNSYAHAPAPAPPAAATTAASSSGQPGLLAQMAATAGSVAVGSTIGHGISSMLFGGGGQAASAQEAPASAPPVQHQQASGISCEAQAKGKFIVFAHFIQLRSPDLVEFTKCLEKADYPSCTWYLEQLKACQAAAAPY
ncbi:hypothetical protein Ac2012v2_006577 [Leucoagaricus gongylophorus]